MLVTTRWSHHPGKRQPKPLPGPSRCARSPGACTGALRAEQDDRVTDQPSEPQMPMSCRVGPPPRDHDGMRVTGFLTNTTPGGPAHQLADLELRHRRHARVEDRIRNGKDTGLANLPFHDAAQNRIWLTKHSWKQVMHSPLETAGSIIIGRCHSRCVLLAV